MLAMMLISILKVVMPFITLLALQEILNLAQKSIYSNLLVYIVIYFMSLVGWKILDLSFDYTQGMFKVKINFDINCLIIDKSQKLNLSDYENSDTYDKLQRALKETTSAFQCISSIFRILTSLISLVGSLIIIILWRWYLVGALIFVPIVSFYFTTKIGKYEFNILYERISGIRKINYLRSLMNDVNSFKENKVLKNDKYLYDKFKTLFKCFIKNDQKILRYKSINAIIFNILESVIGVGVVIAVIHSLMIKSIFIGTANTYIQCIWAIIKNTDQTINSLASIHNKSQYLKSLFDFIEDKHEDVNSEEQQTIEINEIKSIEFINVSFRYKEELPYVLHNINLKINKNEKIVLVGDSGSGKSTFIKLLSGLYSNYEGKILINGIPMRNISKKSFYDKVGMVYQDFIKYEFTLKENLLLGNKGLEEREILRRIRRITDRGIMSFYSKISKKLDTQLGTQFDKGIQLSGGEWQQIAFTRAIIKNMDMLVLDEPSSALDVMLESKMYDILCEDTKNIISLLVTHRLYIADRFAKRAIVFRNGRIIEDDTIERLMAYNSYYKSMLNKTILSDDMLEQRWKNEDKYKECF